MIPQPPPGLPDEELLEGIAEVGGRLLRTVKEKQAEVGSIRDDERWGGPIPLRFELQLATLFLGALDAYDITTGILRSRASQQAFNGLRFQLETLALIRWLVERPEPRERQKRSYRVLYGQISRWAKLLKEDTGGEPVASGVVERVVAWQEQLRELAKQDGLNSPRSEPDRRYLFTEYVPESGYPTFSMYSELGAHPGALGNILFSLRPESRTIVYTLDESFVARAFWSAAAIVHLWQTCETVSACLGWDEWLTAQARPIYEEAALLMDEARKRRTDMSSP